MNLYLKLFLFFFIGTIVAVIIASFLIGYPEIGISFGIPFAFILSVISTLILGNLHTISVKKLHSNSSKEALNVSHIQNIELPVPYGEVFDLCLESIKLIKSGKIKNKNRSEGIINAKVGLNWKTWGDKISFKLTNIGINRTRVEFSSKPVVPTTLVDYGKNLENIEIINNFLKGNNN